MKKKEEERDILYDIYSPYRKDCCEECGSKNEYDAGGYLVKKRRLTVHHVDGNRFNNDPSNLQTLCRKCHDKKHNL